MAKFIGREKWVGQFNAKIIESCDDLLDNHSDSNEPAIQAACEMALQYKADSLAD